jgi:hypothetical protein
MDLESLHKIALDRLRSAGLPRIAENLKTDLFSIGEALSLTAGNLFSACQWDPRAAAVDAVASLWLASRGWELKPPSVSEPTDPPTGG